MEERHLRGWRGMEKWEVGSPTFSEAKRAQLSRPAFIGGFLDGRNSWVWAESSISLQTSDATPSGWHQVLYLAVQRLHRTPIIWVYSDIRVFSHWFRKKRLHKIHNLVAGQHSMSFFLIKFCLFHNDGFPKIEISHMSNLVINVSSFNNWPKYFAVCFHNIFPRPGFLFQSVHK